MGNGVGFPGLYVGALVGRDVGIPSTNVGDIVGKLVGDADSVTTLDSNPTYAACTVANVGLLAKFCTKEPSATPASSPRLRLSPYVLGSVSFGTGTRPCKETVVMVVELELDDGWDAWDA